MRKPAIFITGAAKRIGRFLAKHYAHAGHPVAIHYNSSKDEALALVDALRIDGGNAAAVGGDLADNTVPAILLDEAADALEIEMPVQILINNASLFEEDDIRSLNADSFERHMRINTEAPLLLTQALAAGVGHHPGLVVNIIDQRVWRLNPQFISYTVSKSALWTLTQTLAQALAPAIRVNAIGPGPTLANSFQADGDFAREAEAVPLKRGPKLEEFVRAIDFFIAAPSVTGQMIALDGGQHLAWQTPDIEFAKP